MPERYSSGSAPRRNTNERSSSTASRTAYSGGARRPQGSRPSQGRRPAPRRRKKKAQPRFFVIALIVIVLIVALILLLGGNKGGDKSTAQTSDSGVTATVVTDAASDTTSDAAQTDASAEEGSTSYSTLSEWLGDESSDLQALSEEDRVQVSDLAINTSLPDTWQNFLLLGTDERIANESARTDTMIICSINSSTGAVKLTSIMRDLAVEFDDLGQYNGTYRINSANYFGGPEYAMRIINECFGMNIQYYATVNFFGFQKVATLLGGIDVDITEAEMNEINNKLLDQYHIANAAGEEAPTIENDYLQTYGPNTHLTGHQTLAYARIRKSDGSDSDFTRAERQRTVLTKLMEKLEGKGAFEIASLAATVSEYIDTNMDWDTIAKIAVQVLNSGLTDVETFRLPVNGSYTEESRREQAMLYDCDWEENQLQLYNFIYE